MIVKKLTTFSNTLCRCADFSTIYSFKKECALMGREIYDIINDMAEVLNASQMQKLQEVLAIENNDSSAWKSEYEMA